MKKGISRLNKIFLTLGAFGVLLLIWQIAFFCVGNELLLPAPLECLKEVFSLLGQGRFWKGFLSTLLRALAAFFTSLIIGGCFAVVAYLFPPFRDFLAPIVAFFRALPTVAVILLILVFSTPSNAPVIVACLALAPMLYSSTLAAFLGVDEELIELCKVYRVPLKKRVLSLYLPTASPYLLRESAAGLSFSLKLVVSAEVLADTYESIGGMLQEAKIGLEIPSLFALTVCVVAVGFLVEWLGHLLAHYVARRVK